MMSDSKIQFDAKIQKALTTRREKGLQRSTQVFSHFSDNRISLSTSNATAESTPYINFSSNDYLGLAREPELISAWQQGLNLYGCGSSASPTVTGLSMAHQSLQDKLCEWLGYPRAVLFNSGFSANQALLFTLLDKHDHLIQDKLNHASLMEAGMLSPAPMSRFKHNDMNDLSCKLAALSLSQAKLVVSEGVFSMDGDVAPLNELSHQCQKHQAWLAIDDAHGLGVLGASGAGVTELLGIKPNILIVTFGKAVGLSGAAILCDESTGEFLNQFARHYVYSTAMPPAQAYAISYAITMIQQQTWRREKLIELAEILHESLSTLSGYRVTNTAIKPLICGSSQQAIDLSSYLKQKGMWVGAIRPPTVPANSARLRITLSSCHSPQQVSRLTQEIIQYYQLNKKSRGHD
ncbi:8-amino-7-oxononanoate synthase [Vibrio algivorus]|uniref:8-amino-7-oxononanoate synthase n=1 Tax=Vibrio algivorus TaxID=1667024 RepID=A0ABQ6ESX3_9VIBR|nr:8-amino-7-oxononanoate synthase [Vibrio algivorus]GLT15826.1 8-amino-7-oxononanoate synthase [Vibrio algivorus]